MKALFFVETFLNVMVLTVPKWVLIIRSKKTPNAPKFICPICLSKPRKLKFQWKKTSLGVHSPLIESLYHWKIRFQNHKGDGLVRFRFSHKSQMVPQKSFRKKNKVPLEFVMCKTVKESLLGSTNWNRRNLNLVKV